MNTVTDTCPPLEDIAAFLDGNLSEEERARIVAHLADCEGCYAVFADSARFLLAETEESQTPAALEKEAPAPVVPLRRRTIPQWALPLAAVLVLGLSTIPLYLQYNRMPEMLSTELVDLAALESVPTARLWAEDMRGDSTEVVTDASPFEFLLGVRQVDLRLTLARNDSAESLNVLSRINGHLENLILVDEASAFYLRAHREIHTGRPPKELVEEAARVEAGLTEDYRELPHLAFGKWTEAGRLSALGRSPAFFADRDNRRFPGWLVRKAEENLGDSEEVVRNLKKIRGILDDSDPSELPYGDLEKQFERILEHYQREADAAGTF